MMFVVLGRGSARSRACSRGGAAAGGLLVVPVTSTWKIPTELGYSNAIP